MGGRREPTPSLIPMRTQTQTTEVRDGSSPETSGNLRCLVVNHLGLQTVRNKSPLCLGLEVYGILVEQPQTTSAQFWQSYLGELIRPWSFLRKVTNPWDVGEKLGHAFIQDYLWYSGWLKDYCFWGISLCRPGWPWIHYHSASQCWDTGRFTILQPAQCQL